MNSPELDNEVINRSVAIFEHPDEPAYSVAISIGAPYPRIYQPYDMDSAAIEAMIEADMIQRATNIHEIIQMRNQITEEIKKGVPNWAAIEMGRAVLAMTLNNYGGPGQAFNPN